MVWHAYFFFSSVRPYLGIWEKILFIPEMSWFAILSIFTLLKYLFSACIRQRDWTGLDWTPIQHQ